MIYRIASKRNENERSFDFGWQFVNLRIEIAEAHIYIPKESNSPGRFRQRSTIGARVECYRRSKISGRHRVITVPQIYYNYHVRLPSLSFCCQSPFFCDAILSVSIISDIYWCYGLQTVYSLLFSFFINNIRIEWITI